MTQMVRPGERPEELELLLHSSRSSVHGARWLPSPGLANRGQLRSLGKSVSTPIRLAGAPVHCTGTRVEGQLRIGAGFVSEHDAGRARLTVRASLLKADAAVARQHQYTLPSGSR